jgi:hypothetical protein
MKVSDAQNYQSKCGKCLKFFELGDEGYESIDGIICVKCFNEKSIKKVNRSGFFSANKKIEKPKRKKKKEIIYPL